MRGGRDAVGSAVAVTGVSTTRCPATTMPAPTRSDHGGLSHFAAAAAPRPPRPGSAVCSRSRIRDGGSTAAGHIRPGSTIDMPPAGRPLSPLASLRAQRRWSQSADGWPCKPLCVAAPRWLAVRARGPGRAAASASSLWSAGAPRATVPGADWLWWVAGVGWRAEWAGGAAERGGRQERAAATGRQRARPAQAGRLDPVKKL